MGKTLNADLSPSAGASHAMAFIRSHGKGEVNTSLRLGEILKQAEVIKGGDMSSVEEMLYSQSLTLQSLFNQMTAIGSSLLSTSAGEDRAIAVFELALKAQNQCRQTLQALNELKNPKKPAQFVKTQLNQLRIDSPQQIERSNYAPLDIGSESEAGSTHPAVEALDRQHRSHQRRGKAAKQQKCP